MVTPELKWPITNLTPLPANLLAIETPCLGSDTSSPLSRAIFWPRIPPLALMSATACSVPFLICAPKEAFGPVIGPPTPNLTWAAASPAAPHPIASPRPNARPSVVKVFMRVSPLCRRSGCREPAGRHRRISTGLNRNSRQKSSCFAHVPAARPCDARSRPVPQDAVLPRHLARPRDPKARHAEQKRDAGIDRIEMQRQQGSAEQRKMEKPYDRAQHQHIGGEAPPRPPGLRDGATGKPSRPAAQHEGDEQEDAEGVFLVEPGVRHGRVSGRGEWRAASRRPRSSIVNVILLFA